MSIQMNLSAEVGELMFIMVPLMYTIVLSVQIMPELMGVVLMPLIMGIFGFNIAPSLEIVVAITAGLFTLIEVQKEL